MDEMANVAPALVEIEHEVTDALAGAVIGVAPAAAGLVDGKPLGRDQFCRVRAGACRIERRMFEQPDEFARALLANRGDARLHCPKRLGIGLQPFGHAPFDIVVRHAAQMARAHRRIKPAWRDATAC